MASLSPAIHLQHHIEAADDEQDWDNSFDFTPKPTSSASFNLSPARLKTVQDSIGEKRKRVDLIVFSDEEEEPKNVTAQQRRAKRESFQVPLSIRQKQPSLNAHVTALKSFSSALVGLKKLKDELVTLKCPNTDLIGRVDLLLDLGQNPSHARSKSDSHPAKKHQGADTFTPDQAEKLKTLLARPALMTRSETAPSSVLTPERSQEVSTLSIPKRAGLRSFFANAISRFSPNSSLRALKSSKTGGGDSSQSSVPSTMQKPAKKRRPSLRTIFSGGMSSANQSLPPSPPSGKLGNSSSMVTPPSMSKIEDWLLDEENDDPLPPPPGPMGGKRPVAVSLSAITMSTSGPGSRVEVQPDSLNALVSYLEKVEKECETELRVLRNACMPDVVRV